MTVDAAVRVTRAGAVAVDAPQKFRNFPEGGIIAKTRTNRIECRLALLPSMRTMLAEEGIVHTTAGSES
jgi:hypothetical protein